MRVVLFQNRFAGLVRIGRKRQTIRPERGRFPIRVGERLSLRRWIGRPYRSKQKEIRKIWVRGVARIEIQQIGIFLEGTRLSYTDALLLAFNDGFASVSELRNWFSKTHGIPFRGVLIEW